jgi:hypothetical protein
MTKLIAITIALPLMTTTLACRKSEPPPPAPAATAAPATTLPAPVSVSAISLGTAIGSDKRVTAAAEPFSPKDTIYASVETAGTGHAKLRARWSFVKGDKTAKVDETTIEFDSVGPAVNEFHISKPSGWPKGDYKVEVFLGDAESPAATRNFKVI